MPIRSTKREHVMLQLNLSYFSHGNSRTSSIINFGIRFKLTPAIVAAGKLPLGNLQSWNLHVIIWYTLHGAARNPQVAVVWNNAAHLDWWPVIVSPRGGNGVPRPTPSKAAAARLGQASLPPTSCRDLMCSYNILWRRLITGYPNAEGWN